MKQLNIFDKYKTPEEWKERALTHKTSGAYYVRRFSVPALIMAAALLVGGAFSYNALMKTGKITDDNIDSGDDVDIGDNADSGYIAESLKAHLNGIVLELRKYCAVVKYDESVATVDFEKCEFYDAENNRTDNRLEVGDSVIVNYNGEMLLTFPSMVKGEVTIQKTDSLAASEKMISKLGKNYTGTITSKENGGFATVKCGEKSYRIYCDEISWVYDENNALTDLTECRVGDEITFVYDGDIEKDMALDESNYIGVNFVQKTGNRKAADDENAVFGTAEKIEDNCVRFVPYAWEKESAYTEGFDIYTENVKIIDAEGKETTLSQLQEGEEIIVVYSGEIMEIYPPILGGVTEIKQTVKPYV